MSPTPLRLYFLFGGFIAIFGLSFAIPLLLGDWLLWQPRNLPTELMLSSVYFAMGVVMVAASRNPLAHQGFTDFLIIANLAHAGFMVLYAQHWRHLLLDVAAVGLLGLIPLLIYPWGLKRFLRYSPAD